MLTALSEKLKLFTVLHLKDVIFYISLSTESQELVTFEWENPNTGKRTQLTWMVPLQWFKNSPIIFRNQSAKELEEWKNQNLLGVLLQYVNDILIATETKQMLGSDYGIVQFSGTKWIYSIEKQSTNSPDPSDLLGV